MGEIEMEVLNRKILRLPGNQKGMTLIELLAVLIILGIIIAIAVPSITAVLARSKKEADVNTIKMVREAGLRYALATNAPTGDVNVSTLVNDGYLASTPQLQSKSGVTISTVSITLNANGTYTVKVMGSDNNELTEASITGGS